MNWKIWLLVPVLYGAFAAWYFNTRDAVSQARLLLASAAQIIDLLRRQAR